MTGTDSDAVFIARIKLIFTMWVSSYKDTETNGCKHPHKRPPPPPSHCKGMSIRGRESERVTPNSKKSPDYSLCSLDGFHFQAITHHEHSPLSYLRSQPHPTISCASTASGSTTSGEHIDPSVSSFVTTSMCLVDSLWLTLQSCNTYFVQHDRW